MYLQDKITILLKVYHLYSSMITKIRILEYLTRRSLYTWIATPKPECRQLKSINIANHPRNPSIEVKMNAIHRCFVLVKAINYAHKRNQKYEVTLNDEQITLLKALLPMEETTLTIRSVL